MGNVGGGSSCVVLTVVTLLVCPPPSLPTFIPHLLPDNRAVGKDSAAQSAHRTSRRPSHPARPQRWSSHGETGQAEACEKQQLLRKQRTADEVHPQRQWTAWSATHRIITRLYKMNSAPFSSSDYLSPGHRTKKKKTHCTLVTTCTVAWQHWQTSCNVCVMWSSLVSAVSVWTLSSAAGKRLSSREVMTQKVGRKQRVNENGSHTLSPWHQSLKAATHSGTLYCLE